MFAIAGCSIFLSAKNFISMLVAIEMMLLACGMNFACFSAIFGDVHGQISAIFVLAVIAAKAALGLAIMVVYHRTAGHIESDKINLMKG